ncbi:hypothetical protein CALCODRAFT_497809 [Calocera cornea HHB12733]|uniref:Cora-domain-containing protein n=1 Tax=Calocera cornea HHB12733 TaxID=1353952 RepID=A0A165F3J8_9BASI|nr:hypothetical protein CALCODRAFT_497809 [Calocera cornea HHB12733]
MPAFPSAPHFLTSPVPHSSASTPRLPTDPGDVPPTRPPSTTPGAGPQTYTLGTQGRSRTPSLDGVRPVTSADFDAPGPDSVLASGLNQPDAVLVHPRRPAGLGADNDSDSILDDAQDGGEGDDVDVDDAAVPDSPPPMPAYIGQEVEHFEPIMHSPGSGAGKQAFAEQQGQGQGQQEQGLDGAVEQLDMECEGRAHTPPGGSSTMSTAETRVERERPPLLLANAGPTVTGPSTFAPFPAGGEPGLGPDAAAPLRPSQKFRASALKVMQMHRGSTAIASPGAEQGVDPRRDSAARHWGHIHQECAIEVCDYSLTSATFTRLSNAGLADFLAAKGKDRPNWAKVRWINVGGISWDVIRAIAIRYDLHPLATEDVLRCGESGSRSKSDYYRNHLFLSIMCHSLAPDDEPPSYDASQAAAGEGEGEGEGDSAPGARVMTDSPVQEREGRPAASGSGSAPGLRKRRSSVWQRARDTVVGVSGLPLPLHRTLSRDDIESTFDGLRKNISGSGGDDGPVVPDRGLGDFAGDGPGLLAPPPRSRRRSHSRSHGRSRSHSPGRGDPERDAPDRKAEEAATAAKQRQWASWMSMSPMKRRKAVNQAALQELKRGSHVSVELKHIYVFLTRGGTLITFHQDADLSHFRPIKARLQLKDSLLRAHCDASLLMQSVVDLVVDKALEVVDRYHDTLLDLERQILIKPGMKTVRQLHIMSGDLTLHKRTLTPLSTMIYALRRYDLDRAVAATPEAQDGRDVKVTGFCSHQCKVYLADVYDHMEYILSSMDMFSSIAENLINFTFNIVSYETNQSMRRLTVATVLFFPLTFLTGYFGMNFQQMNSLVGSDLFFWEVALPVMFVITVMFTWNDIVKMYRAFSRSRRFDSVKERLKLMPPKTHRA